MAQAILIATQPQLRDLLSLNLNTQLGVQVIVRQSAQEAIELLQLLPSVEFVISDYKIGGEASAKLLSQFIQKQRLETQLIVLGLGKNIDPELGSHVIPIEVANDWKLVIRKVATIMGVNTQTINASEMKPEYYPIPLTYFLALERSCCDAFIRIKKGPTEYQYVKLIHRGDPFEKQTIYKYQAQALTHFHVPYDQKDQFANDISNQLVIKLDKALQQLDKGGEVSEQQMKEQIELVGQSYDVAMNEILQWGFNTATIQLTESVVESMKRVAAHHPEVSPLLHKVINSQTSYLYQHAHLSAIVAVECLRGLEHFNEADAHKLTYAAFFQNISLANDEELAQIYTTEQLEQHELQKELSDEEWDSVFFHAREAALTTQKYPKLPIEVTEIVRSHHGAVNGKGLNVQKIEELSMLTQIFIVACNFAHEILHFKVKGGTPKPIVEVLKQRFPQPSLQVVTKAIEKTLKKTAKK